MSDLDRIYARLEVIEQKIDRLNEFKWKMVGAGGVVGFAVSVFGVFLLKHIIGG